MGEGEGGEALSFFRFHLSPFPQKRLILRLRSHLTPGPDSGTGMIPERLCANPGLKFVPPLVFTFLSIAQSNILCYHYWSCSSSYMFLQRRNPRLNVAPIQGLRPGNFLTIVKLDELKYSQRTCRCSLPRARQLPYYIIKHHLHLHVSQRRKNVSCPPQKTKQ